VANSQPIPLNNELFPTIGMQTADEMVCEGESARDWLMGLVDIESIEHAQFHQNKICCQIDANFGQRPFVYDIRVELEVKFEF
jgi:hypothetical protein